MMDTKIYSKKDVQNILNNIYKHREHVTPDFQPKVGKMTFWAVSASRIKRELEKYDTPR